MKLDVATYLPAYPAKPEADSVVATHVDDVYEVVYNLHISCSVLTSVNLICFVALAHCNAQYMPM